MEWITFTWVCIALGAIGYLWRSLVLLTKDVREHRQDTLDKLQLLVHRINEVDGDISEIMTRQVGLVTEDQAGVERLIRCNNHIIDLANIVLDVQKLVERG